MAPNQPQSSQTQRHSHRKSENIHVCLLMMVRDEEHCIARAIESALPYVDSILLVDTGSKDKTVSVARETAEGKVPINVVFHHWDDFGSNRTRAYEAFQDWVYDEHPLNRCYALLLDADDVVTSFPTELSISSEPDCFTAMKVTGDWRYPQIQLVKATTDFVWVGSTHEEIRCYGRDANVAELPGFEMSVGSDSRRRLDGRKSTEDIELLHQDLAKDPKNTRALFYLGRSYMAVGKISEAIGVLMKRANMKGFDEEVYLANVWLGQCLLSVNKADDAVLSWLQAIDLRPHRLEAYTCLAESFLSSGNKGLAAMFARAGRQVYVTTDNRDKLFVDVSCIERLREAQFGAEK